MRSQVFGFHVDTVYLHEMTLSCSFRHACETLTQFTRRYEMVHRQLKTILTGSAYTQGFEIPLNEWDEEVVILVSQILREHPYGDEFIRMGELKKALSWLWPRFRATIVLAQYMFTATIDGNTNLFVYIGWNNGASEVEQRIASQFFQLYVNFLKDLGISVVLHFAQLAEEHSEPRRYGPRAETREKLEELCQLREAHKQEYGAAPVRTVTCETAGIAPATVKKYEPELYDRWYDADY